MYLVEARIYSRQKKDTMKGHELTVMNSPTMLRLIGGDFIYIQRGGGGGGVWRTNNVTKITMNES